jgi:formylglycine-generating enzyme required for sulfatase activity
LSLELLRLRDPLGERPVSPHELPLSIGGEGATIAVPGQAEGTLAARVGVDDNGLFIEPVEGGPEVFVNGRKLFDRVAIEPGDVIATGDARIFCIAGPRGTELRAEHLSGNATPAPLLTEEERQAELEDAAPAQAIQRTVFRPSSGKVAVARARSPLRWAVSFGLVLVVAFFWFLATARSVNVVTQPVGANVDFVGAWPEISFGTSHLVRPGSYVLAASHQGYEPARRPVRVTSEAQQSLSVTLVKLPGLVTFDTGGVAATASVDGKPLGRIPGEYRVPAGTRALVIRAPRYQDFTAPLEVTGGGAKQTYKAQLVPGFSAISIESKPQGAKVAVDGKEIGITPITTDLDAGTYTLTLAAEGFRNWESSIQVQANKPQHIGPVELGLPDGHLTVRSSPSPADVAVGGRYRGRTPLEIALPPGVEQEIVLTRAGYEEAHRRVGIKPSERLAVDVTLKPILGQVTVRGEPKDAQLFIDGQARGSAQQTIALPAAELVLEVRHEGFQTFTTRVTPQPGFERVVEYRLLTPDEARASKYPASVRTKTGGELRLMPTGTFQMGTPRREPGRRANETLRTVTLQRPFYFGVREVTNGEFRKFRPEHLSGVVKDISLDQDSHPAVSVTWRDAAEYCNWLSTQEGLPVAYRPEGDELVTITPLTTGYRLPTEAEWEWVARYDNGSAKKRYPWGNSLPVPQHSGNYADASALELLDIALDNYQDGFETTAPVGSFAANPLGVYDLGGNVAEWTNDFYTVYLDLSTGQTTDPVGPAQGRTRVVRGSSWRTANITELRLAYRGNEETRAQSIGFRIARYAE